MTTPKSRGDGRKPEPAEVRQARKGVADAANALAAAWSDRDGRKDAQATLDKARAALDGALARHKLPA